MTVKLTQDLVNPFTGEVMAEAGQEFPTIAPETKGQLAQDTINVALSIAGYNIALMTQFDKASAVLDMAHELAAQHQCNGSCRGCQDDMCANYKPSIDNDDDVAEAKRIAESFGRVHKEVSA